MKKKMAVIALLGNAKHDSRVVNLTKSLNAEKYNVKVISFDWETDNFKSVKGNFAIHKISKKNSFYYYLRFIFILMKELFNTKGDIYFAEDVYTLPFVAIVSKIKKGKFYYNSRELYPFVAGLRNKSFTQKIIATIEKIFISKADIVLTTGEMDSEFLTNYYGLKRALVIRNIPAYIKVKKENSLRKKFNISDDKIILLYQGVLLEGRGLPLSIRLLKSIKNAVLILIGDGPFKNKFEKYAEEIGVLERTFFMGKISHEELISYTVTADFGLCLIENISKSYYYALPNKLFEYIMAGIPVITSDLPQMKKIIEGYNVGTAVNIKDEERAIAEVVRTISDTENTSQLKKNCNEAAKELNWEIEFDKVKKVLLK